MPIVTKWWKTSDYPRVNLELMLHKTVFKIELGPPGSP